MRASGRVRHHVLQVPVVRFRHRQTGQLVTIAATFHVAEAAFYEQLTALVTRLEAAGAVIYSEGLGLAGEKEWAAETAVERAARNDHFGDLRRRYQAMGDYLGWVPQRFPDMPSWRNVDMTDLEFIKRAEPQGMRSVSALEQRMGVAVGPQAIGAIMAIAVRLDAADRFGLLARLRRMTGGDGFRRAVDVVVGERNRLLLAALAPGEDAVLVWGAGHLPGLAAGLRTAGYRRQATEWVNVGTLPPIWKCLRDFWDGFDEHGDEGEHHPNRNCNYSASSRSGAGGHRGEGAGPGPGAPPPGDAGPGPLSADDPGHI